jgi:hypothetical protein
MSQGVLADEAPAPATLGRAMALQSSARVYLESLRDSRTALQHVCTQELNFELAGRLALARYARGSIWGMDYRGEG